MAFSASVIAFSWVDDPTPSLSMRATMVAPSAVRSLSVCSLTDQSILQTWFGTDHANARTQGKRYGRKLSVLARSRCRGGRLGDRKTVVAALGVRSDFSPPQAGRLLGATS